MISTGNKLLQDFTKCPVIKQCSQREHYAYSSFILWDVQLTITTVHSLVTVIIDLTFKGTSFVNPDGLILFYLQFGTLVWITNLQFLLIYFMKIDRTIYTINDLVRHLCV